MWTMFIKTPVYLNGLVIKTFVLFLTLGESIFLFYKETYKKENLVYLKYFVLNYAIEILNVYIFMFNKTNI